MMADAGYVIVNNENELQFEITMGGEKAYLSYRFYKKDIALIHTFVPRVFEGKGIASWLAREAFAYALKQKKPVMVFCPFVAGFVKKYPEYKVQLDREYHKS